MEVSIETSLVTIMFTSMAWTRFSFGKCQVGASYIIRRLVCWIVYIYCCIVSTMLVGVSGGTVKC